MAVGEALGELAARAPDVVEVHRAYAGGEFGRMRRELRHRSGPGSAASIAAQLDAVAETLASRVASMPGESFELPGGEADWTVSEALGHDIDARDLLVTAARMAAAGRWPESMPGAVPSVPGKAGAGREALLERLAKSRRRAGRAARGIAGHEADPCPLDHPQLGRLRCGEWLLFAGVHDLMHLEQLERLCPAWRRP